MTETEDNFKFQIAHIECVYLTLGKNASKNEREIGSFQRKIEKLGRFRWIIPITRVLGMVRSETNDRIENDVRVGKFGGTWPSTE